MTNEQREALLAGKPTKEFDITKHKDWPFWLDTLKDQCYYWSSNEQILEAVASRIFAAGQEAVHAEIRVLRQRVADAQDDLGPDWRSDDTEFRNE